MKLKSDSFETGALLSLMEGEVECGMRTLQPSSVCCRRCKPAFEAARSSHYTAELHSGMIH